MTDEQWQLVDDLLMEMDTDKGLAESHGGQQGDNWYCIGPKTHAALRALWERCVELDPETKQ